MTRKEPSENVLATSHDDLVMRNELEARFDPERISALTIGYLDSVDAFDWHEIRKDKKFAMCVIPANSRYADIGRVLETTKFADVFKRPIEEVYQEYTEYDEASTFLLAIDIQADMPVVAGAMRVIEPNDSKGLKSINDLVADEIDNPWIDEVKALYFDEGETYEPMEAWYRMCDRASVCLEPSETHDIATIVVDNKYGTSGSIDGTSIALYHTCLRYALGNGIKNLVSIQDIIPLQFLQQFGDCFSFFEGLEPHPYGGPYDTIPAWAELQEGMRRVRSSGYGEIFIEGQGIDEEYLMIKDYMSEVYSDKTLRLGEYLAKVDS